MSDQNTITDWKAYFGAMVPRKVYAGPNITPMFQGAPNPYIVYAKTGALPGDLETVQLQDGESPFEVAKDIYEANEGPEMWLFSHPSEQPWRCPALPKVKKRKT